MSVLWRKGCLALLCGVLAACGSSETKTDAPPSGSTAQVEVDLDKSNPERLLRYYFGGYAASGGADPFTTNLLAERGGRFFVDLDVLDAENPGVGAALRQAAGDDRLEWEEFAAFLHATYYAARQAPPTLADFEAETPYRSEEAAWFHVELDGVMSVARRHVYVEEAALRHALTAYRQNDDRLIYPEGTAVIGEHYLEGARVETTILHKRADGFWDFLTYGSDGALAARTESPPRALKTPTQCVGCHFGAKLFEPERSFPGTASPGPHGPRAFYVDDALRDGEVVAFFDEHRKRSDTVLGIYNTLFVAHLRAERRAGRIAEADARLLADLGL